MVNRSAAGALAVVVLAVAATACSTIEGRPTAAGSAATRSPAAATNSPSATTTLETPLSAPAGPPVGTATMQVRGGDGPVTVRYEINGDPEQTETNVTLPWEKQYPVYNEVESKVTADGGDAPLTCSIIMDGKLVTFKSEPRPTCSFGYWG
jgi:hypothetical protein